MAHRLLLVQHQMLIENQKQTEITYFYPIAGSCALAHSLQVHLFPTTVKSKVQKLFINHSIKNNLIYFRLVSCYYFVLYNELNNSQNTKTK